MIRTRLPTLALIALLAAGTARGGSITIASSSPTVMVGQSVTLTVSIAVTDPAAPPSGDWLFSVLSILGNTGISPATLSEPRLAPGVPSGAEITSYAPPPGSAHLFFTDPNGLSSFDGPVYQFDFTPASRGEYTFAFPDPSIPTDWAYFNDGGGLIYLTPGPAATIMAFGATSVPEPTGLALAGVCLSGLALRAWRKQRVASTRKGGL
jgi:hypothetical protein